MMKKITILFLCLAFFNPFNYSQTPISDTINHYTAVVAINNCKGILTVEDTTGFETGMNVILIQHKGISINETNSAAFGNVLDAGSAGFYEKNEIDSISASHIFLKYQLLHDYDANGKVQVVTIPHYENAVVTELLTAPAWDGEKGGVLAFSVENELTLEADIDLSGKGFRGGISISVNPNNCSWLNQQNDFYYGLNNWRAAEKGEGAADFIAGKEAGKGAQFNGGGGGNDHNSGGGGGANGGTGGLGGENDEPQTFGCKGFHPGFGGKTIAADSSRLFFGGGGGAGHGNNDLGTNGGNGGGIIIIEAGSIVSNGFKIISNGETPPDGFADGAGGGGAGGSMALKFDVIADALSLELKGGNGGLVNNNNVQRCHGPGGGGGGGQLFIAAGTGNWSIDQTGGIAGLSVNSAGCPDSNNGAEDGNTGTMIQFSGLPQSNIIDIPIEIAAHPADQITCPEIAVIFTTSATGNSPNFQWQVDDGSGFQDISDGVQYSGTTTDTLTVLNPTELMSGWLFRCIVSNNCNELETESAILEVVEAGVLLEQPQAASACEGEGLQFSISATGSGLEFQWQLDDGSGFSDLPDNATYSGTQTPTLTLSTIDLSMAGYIYRCVVTDACGNELTSDAAQLTVLSTPVAQFDYSVNANEVDFNNLSLNANSYEWDFGDNSGSSQSDPNHIYLQNGIYTIQLIALNDCGADTTFQEIEIEFLQAPTAGFTLNNGTGCAPLQVQFSDQSAGDVESWQWAFEGGNPATSVEQNPVVIYENPGLFDVSLIVSNAGGSDTTTYEELIEIHPPVTAGFTFIVNGNTVTFTNTSQNAVNFQWDFGDGSPFASEANPVHEYVFPGVYMVTLVATNPLCGSAITLTVDATSSTKQGSADESRIGLFPNPATELLTIQFVNFDGHKNIRLFNTNGQLIFEKKEVEDQQLEIGLSAFPSGIYIVEITSGEGIFVGKFLKY